MRKGIMGLVTLAIGTMIMIAFIMIASLAISRNPVSTDLQASMAYSEHIYIGQVAAATLFQNGELWNKSSKLTVMETDERKEKVKQIAENGLKMGYRSHLFDIEGVKGEETENPYGQNYGMRLVIASPDTKKRVAVVKAGDPG